MNSLNGIIDVQINDKLIYPKCNSRDNLTTKSSDFNVKSIGVENTIRNNKKEGNE